MDVQSVVPSSTTRPLPHNAQSAHKKDFLHALLTNFELSTWLLIGACLQSSLFLLLPYRYMITPVAALLAIRTINTILITTGVKKNPYLKGVLPKKTTAQLLDKNGEFAGPGHEKIAVLLLGAKSNHPLGAFAPDFKTVGDLLDEMTHQLESTDDQDNGFLGQSGWQRRDLNSANELLFLSYWRSIDDVHTFAHGPLHRNALKWWDSTLKEHGHIGFMHELYEADKGQWETLYINFQPTGLGATTFLRRNAKMQGGYVDDEWVSPLLDANRGKMRTSLGRRGQDV